MSRFDSIRPLRGRVTVKFGKPKDEVVGGVRATKTTTGIYVPSNAAERLADEYREEDERRNEGFVLRIGSNPRDAQGNVVEPEFSKGDRVLVKKDWGTLAAETDEEELRLFNFAEIAAVIEEPNA